MPAPGRHLANTGGPFHALAFDANTFDIAVATNAGISIGGIDVRGRVRMSGLTIRDVLNDAPNTCNLTIEGDAPAVGQALRITINDGLRVLFAGTIQTIDQSYESTPDHVAWQCTAIDDTARANARRPFGNWVLTSATTIAQTMTAQFAPGFSDAGIELGLPDVSIVFDGADTFIAALARLATAIGGYCKVEDGTIYLFLTDTFATPDPLDDDHPFLNSPPIQVNTDSSQLRTRVYGKGYGESIVSDIDAGETLIPIQDGVNFPPLGGKAIAAVTADGAQSERVAYTGVELSGGGTLVGPGASPANAPIAALAAGAGVTTGTHTIAVVFVTAAGKTLPGPVVSIDVGTLAAPTTAPVAGTAINGTGPDQGSHDYAASFVTSYGETTPSPISNAITTSAAVGQLAAPSSAVTGTANTGSGVTTGGHSYVSTFVNAAGETTPSPISGNVTTGDVLVGQLPYPTSAPTASANTIGSGPDAGYHYYGITFGDSNGDTELSPYQLQVLTQQGGEIPNPTSPPVITSGHSGGDLVNGQTYYYAYTFGNATGETTNGGWRAGAVLGFGNSIELTIPTGPTGTTKRFVYRGDVGWGDLVNPKLVATINDNTTTYLLDGLAEGSRGKAAPSVNTTSVPYHVVNLTNIPIGPSGTTNRKVWRNSAGAGFKYVATLANNLTAALTDTTPNSGLGAPAPTSNTTGSMVPYNHVALSGIPIGAAGTTARRIYRRFNSAGDHKFVTTITNNTETTYTDTKSNGALGAVAPTSNTTGTAVQVIPVTNIPLGPVGVTSRKLYRRFNGAGTFKLVTTIANNTGTTFNDGVANSGLGAAALSTSTAIGNQIALTAIPVGAVAVTARELYMTAVGSAVKKLATTIANNTATTATITTSDATLAGAATAPVSDTSGLTQPPGQINPGSTVLPVASASTFRTAGGWVAISGGQVARYTGISGQTLTGIPPTGAGSINTTVLYGSQALPAPMLIGVSGLTLPVLKGSAVHIWIQRDDATAQVEQAARAGGGDGVIEYLITDNRRGEDSLAQRVDADLAMFSRPIVTAGYATRDIKTRSGKTVAIDLASPLVDVTLTIQDVTITEIDIVPGLAPRFTVKASSVRFSLEDTLRQLIVAA